jgi:hypothetical protein
VKCEIYTCFWFGKQKALHWAVVDDEDTNWLAHNGIYVLLDLFEGHSVIPGGGGQWVLKRTVSFI